MSTESEIGEVVARVRQRSLTVCENCGGEGYTDMGKSACAECFGAGVTTPEMLARLAETDRLHRILSKGPASPAECAEFCMSAREDGDGKPCLDCDPSRFTL